MRNPFPLTGRGTYYVLRGLRQGRPPLVAVGIFMILRRLLKRRRNGGRVVSVRLKRGSSVALRVSPPGDDPVTFRMDPVR